MDREESATACFIQPDSASHIKMDMEFVDPIKAMEYVQKKDIPLTES